MRGQGRIYDRAGRYWVAYYHRGRQVRESVLKVTGKNTRRAAEDLLRERLRTAGTARFVGPAAERVTFDDLASLYLTDFRLNRRRSLRDAERNVRTVGATFGLDRALDITTARIAGYTEHRLSAGMRPASVNRELAALRRMFKLAVRRQLVPVAPPIELLSEKDNVREGFMEPAEFEIVGTALPSYLLDPARFAYVAGWRKGEVSSLE